MLIEANTTIARKHLNQFPFGAAVANCQKSDFGKLVAGGKHPASALHSCFDVKSIEFTAPRRRAQFKTSWKSFRPSGSASRILTHSLDACYQRQIIIISRGGWMLNFNCPLNRGLIRVLLGNKIRLLVCNWRNTPTPIKLSFAAVK